MLYRALKSEPGRQRNSSHKFFRNSCQVKRNHSKAAALQGQVVDFQTCSRRRSLDLCLLCRKSSVFGLRLSALTFDSDDRQPTAEDTSPHLTHSNFLKSTPAAAADSGSKLSLASIRAPVSSRRSQPRSPTAARWSCLKNPVRKSQISSRAECRRSLHPLQRYRSKASPARAHFQARRRAHIQHSPRSGNMFQNAGFFIVETSFRRSRKSRCKRLA